MRFASKLALFSLLIGLTIPFASAQNRVSFAGHYSAIDYAYGIAPGIAPLSVATGNTATGTASVTIVLPCITTGAGTTVCPLATNAPITIGTGSTQETITPTALSNCSFPSAPYGACTVTASFTYTHGTGEIITSGSYGIQEAINIANSGTGGTVVVDKAWAGMGGTNAKISGATAYSNVVIEDARTGDSFWSMQPSTLTSLAIPTPTLSSTTAVFSAAPVGTWANSAYYLCYTYVDALGGEGPCSATSNQTPTLNYSLAVTSPAASTGAVGWRMYAGATYNLAYLAPITSANCTLTTLESVMPACAIGSNAVFLAPPLTTTSLRPNATVSAGALATPTVNISATQPQGHTTFAYQPSGLNPLPFQTHYGPFPQFGSTTSGQIDILGSINLPAGFLNTIGRTVLLKGKLVLGTTNTAALPTLTFLMSWAGGTTAGVGLTTCSFGTAATGSTVAYNGEFECTLTTNAVGTTAVGSIMTGGSVLYQVVSGAAAGLGPNVDLNTAAVGSLGLFSQDTINVEYTSTTNTTATVQLMDLHVVVLQ